MVKERSNLRVFFFPLMAHGHMIPALDIAKLFASQGVESTIVTTPANVALVSKSIARTKPKIHIKTIPFPAVDAGLPQGCENLDMITSHALIFKFLDYCEMLREPVEQLLKEQRPDYLVADMFFPWATDSAGKFNIPRLVFHGTSAFALCASEMVRLHEPHKDVSSDEEPFVIPNLPDEIKLTRMQLPEFVRVEDDGCKLRRLLIDSQESELRSYGVVVNSFYELEPAYAEFYRNILKRRTWHIGPVSLCNKNSEDKMSRGKQAAIDEQACLKWLDSKKANSVVYVCFGSTSRFSTHQLREIAMALEASEQQFIWVVKRVKEDEADEDYLPAGFAERIHDRGMIIRGWAPQVLILDHEAVGGFVTHCGWNSSLEGISAGVPMVTWPVFAEQFYNEKLVTEVLRIGVSVGVRRWVGMEGDIIKKEAIEQAVRRVMLGEEAEDMRRRATALGKMAKKAFEEGGSSYCELKNLIQELLKSR